MKRRDKIWTIVNGNKLLDPPIFHWTKKECIWDFVDKIKGREPWEKQQKFGYRCIRVIVEWDNEREAPDEV